MEGVIDEVIKNIDRVKFVKLYYLKKDFDGTVEYIKELLYKLRESKGVRVRKEEIEDKTKLPIRVITHLVIHRSLNAVIKAHPKMIDLLKLIEKKRYVLTSDVVEQLKIADYRVKRTLEGLLEFKILQSVTFPVLSKRWVRGYGWYGDSVVHDYLLNKVYNSISAFDLEIDLQRRYVFGHRDSIGEKHEKVTDGKITVDSRNYILEIYTNVYRKLKKIEEELVIYGEFVKDSSYIKQAIIITENRKSKRMITKRIRTNLKYLKTYFLVYFYHESEMK